MKRRPWILIILAAVHVIAPFVNLIFDAYWAGMSVSHYVYLFFQPYYFSQYWFHFLAPIAAGVMIYICRRWSYFIYVTLIVALGFVSYASYFSRWDLYNPTPLILAYVLNLAIVTYFLIPAVRTVYFDPRLRWWEHYPRYQTDIYCYFTGGLQKFKGNVGNFSRSGLFIKSENLPADHTIIQVEFNYEDLNCQFQGQVIHHAKLSSKGFGVQFLHTPQSKKSAKALTDRLQLQGLIQPSRSFTAEDTFRWWLRQFIKTGRGLLPSRQLISSTDRSPSAHSSRPETKS